MRVHSYMVRITFSLRSTCVDFIHVSPTFLEAKMFRLVVFCNLQHRHLPSRQLRKNNIRSQASRTSHRKTSFWEWGRNALRMSVTSVLIAAQVSRSSLPREKRFQVSCFFFWVLSLYAYYTLVFTPQGNVDFLFANDDVSLVCVVFAYSFRGVQPVYS